MKVLYQKIGSAGSGMYYVYIYNLMVFAKNVQTVACVQT